MEFPTDVETPLIDIFAGLYRTDGTVIMTWTKADMTVSGYEAQIPLSQSETMALVAGNAVFEVKLMDHTEAIILFEQIPTVIVERFDKRLMEE